MATFFMAFFYSERYSGEVIKPINTALACAIAIFPEGVEVIVTLTYSDVVNVMASQNNIVRAPP